MSHRKTKTPPRRCGWRFVLCDKISARASRLSQVLQERLDRLASLFPGGRDVQHRVRQVRRLAEMVGIIHDRITIRVVRMPIRQEDLRMVEWCLLIDGPRISKTVSQEINQIDFLLRQ